RDLEGKPAFYVQYVRLPINLLTNKVDFFEEIFHAIFTPTTTNENVIHHVDNEYYGAQITGRNYKGRCEQMFPECRMTLFDSFTQLESQ
ncbi:hypothetical protein NQ318_011868, partial [Aromia moschata]